MNIKILTIALLTAVPLLLHAQDKTYTRNQYNEDFNFFWQSINDDYCYFDKKQTDWDKVKAIYGAAIDTITTRSQFVTIMEQALGEIYDHHASLNTNTDLSPRLVPSGTDIWAEYKGGKPTIVQVKSNSGAAGCGIKAGQQIVAINNIPVSEAVNRLLPRSLKRTDTEAMNCALRLALAGDHIKPRVITLAASGKTSQYSPDEKGMKLEHISYATKTEARIINGIGYIKINNCLYDDDLIKDFDSVMNLMQGTKGLMLDMRETPSGGNTTVARAILGWFTNKEQYYQKHELYAEGKQTGIKRSWVEIVSPRDGKYYSKSLIVLADHWTGSIAEGITIGFKAMDRKYPVKVIGTELARLSGAVYTYTMPNTKINFSFPVERLYTVKGASREFFMPDILIDQEKVTNGRDATFDRAMELLTGKEPKQ
jgi:C-terminal processing protease CtpA/Prc